MAWTDSRIFTSFITDAVNATNAFNIDADTIKAALYNGTAAPDRTVASSLAKYAAASGAWVTGNEVTDSSGWPAGGRALASVTSTFSSGVYTFDAADTSSANSTTTLSNVNGVLIYDDTLTTPVADQALCFNYLGGAQSVTSGTFTVVWNASGIFTFTV